MYSKLISFIINFIFGICLLHSAFRLYLRGGWQWDYFDTEDVVYCIYLIIWVALCAVYNYFRRKKIEEDTASYSKPIYFYTICLPLILPIFGVTVLLLLGLRTEDYENQKADDVISQAIYEQMGTEDIIYLGKETGSQGQIVYDYLLMTNSENVLHQLLSISNKVIEDEGLTDKIMISCKQEIPGALFSVVCMSNYSEWDASRRDYELLQKLYICGVETGSSVDEMYNELEVYRNLPGIKEVEFTFDYQRQLEGFYDWYEYWPELEKVSVDYNIEKPTGAFDCVLSEGINNEDIIHLTTDEYVILNEKDGQLKQFVQAANDALQIAEIEFGLRLPIYCDINGRTIGLFTLMNYPDEEQEEADFSLFYRLKIWGVAQEGIYSDLSVYKAIPGIRYLEITQEIQQKAQADGIDWYEFWPELEMVVALDE